MEINWREKIIDLFYSDALLQLMLSTVNKNRYSVSLYKLNILLLHIYLYIEKTIQPFCKMEVRCFHAAEE